MDKISFLIKQLVFSVVTDEKLKFKYSVDYRTKEA